MSVADDRCVGRVGTKSNFGENPRRSRGSAAQRRGVKFGRKPSLTPEQIDRAWKLIDKGEARQYVAGLLNVGRPTLYRALKF